MGESTALKKVIAGFFGVSSESVHAGFSLEHPRLQSSAGRGVLAAAIRRELGVFCPQAFTARDYGELEAAVFGRVDRGTQSELDRAGAPAVRENAHAGQESVSQDGAMLLGALVGVHVGVDIELVENMPDVPDFWVDDFYKTHFTAAEIAYCLRQEIPRMHFAARWCAKEALAKCDPAYLTVDPTSIQIVGAADRRPKLERLRNGRAETLEYAVSLAHTPAMAVGIVVSLTRREPFVRHPG